MHRTILLLLLASTTGSATGQALPQALAATNEVFGGSVQVKLDKRQQLVFDLYDVSGRFRQDIVLPVDLDTGAIHFSAEEDAIILGCRTDKPQCISKEIFKMNTVRLTSRANLPKPAQDADGKATIAALRALIVASCEQLAANGNETRQRPERMR